MRRSCALSPPLQSASLTAPTSDIRVVRSRHIMRHLEGLILLPARLGPPPASPTPQLKSQHPSTPSSPQEIEEHGDSTFGKRPRDEPTDTNTGDTSGAGATLLTTITPARQVRLNFSIFALRGKHTKFEGGLQFATHSQSGGSDHSRAQDKHTKRSKALRRKFDPALHILYVERKPLAPGSSRYRRRLRSNNFHCCLSRVVPTNTYY